MKTFLSNEGIQSLQDIRVGWKPELGSYAAPAPIRLLARLPSDECGCPEELWHVDGIEVLIHLEEDGRSEIFIFLGDDTVEETVYFPKDINELRAHMFSILAGMGTD